MDINQELKKLEEMSGSRYVFLGHQILTLSTFGQPCDITFFRREPAIDVAIDPQLALAVMYGAGPDKLAEMLRSIKLSDGQRVSIDDIWTINPMPKGGFTEDKLNSADMSHVEEAVGPIGETLREMIRNTYHCKSKDKENYYLRRFIAS